MISLRFSVKGYISLLCGGLVRYITGMGVVGCYAVYMDKVIRHKPNPWWHHLVCRWLLTLTFLVGACGDPAYIDVGSSTQCIVGGHEVGLGPTYSTVDVGGCTGTYIAPGVVLTAAHCGDQGEASTWGYYGDVVRKTTLYVPHPQYDNVTLNNDLALMFLDGALPIPTATLGSASYGKATIQGYGIDETCSSDVLKEATVFVESITAIKLQTSAGSDACYGDSGGPMYQSGALVGVVSHGIPGLVGMDACGAGGFYTRVSAFQAWLDSEVEGLNWVSNDLVR